MGNLKHIDLRENELGDDGAHLVAHMMVAGTNITLYFSPLHHSSLMLCFLAGVFETIATLHLQRNLITNTGIEKIVHIYKAIMDVKCPLLTKLSLGENYATVELKRKLKPTPKGLSI